MSNPLDHDLATIADSVERHAHLTPAAALRRRADRRRAVPVVAVSVAAVVAVAWGSATLLPQLGQDAPPAAASPSATPSAEPTQTPSDTAAPLGAPADDPEVYRGERLVALMTLDGSRVVRVDQATGTEPVDGTDVVPAPQLDGLAQWRPVPIAPGSEQFFVTTASIADLNVAPCLQVEGGAARVEPCDGRVQAQVFGFEPGADADGHPTYALVTADGEGLSLGGERYFLVDEGPAPAGGTD